MRLKITISTDNDEFTGEESATVNELKGDLIGWLHGGDWKISEGEDSINAVELIISDDC